MTPTGGEQLTNKGKPYLVQDGEQTETKAADLDGDRGGLRDADLSAESYQGKKDEQ